MFLDTWDFRLLRGNKESRAAGDLLDPGQWEIEHYVKEFHGIEVTKKPYRGSTDILSEISRQIQNQKPVMVDEDWLVYGIDELQDCIGLYIIHSSRPALLSRELFLKGFNGKGITGYTAFDKSSRKKHDIHPQFIIGHTREQLKKHNKPIHDMIKEYAEIFFMAFDFAAEIKGWPMFTKHLS